MSNIYFIIIAFFHCFWEISNANWKPIILLPISFVILVNRIIEVYDLDKKEFVSRKWKDIFIGNIIKIKKNEYFPADCVLISSSDRKTHNCFVETKNLDGETNLKIKKSINKLVEKCKDLSMFQGKLTTQMPNEYIYQFDAIFEFDMDNLDNNQNINITTKLKGKR